MATIPNLLTLARVILVPFLLLFLCLQTRTGHWVAFSLFLVASFTDYLDGKLARSLSQTSPFGKFFDPVADKLLVASCIFMLAALGYLKNYHILPGLIILCREIFVSGLREFLAQINVSLPVSMLGKCKTAFQFLALILLILHPKLTLPQYGYLEELGLGLLWISAVLTVISGYDYLKAGMKHYRGHFS